MAEITKVTTPMIPRENAGGKFKPVTDQAAELNDISKVNRSQQEGKIQERQDQQAMRESMNRAAAMPLFRDTADLTQAIGKMLLLMQIGISSSDVINDPQVKELLEAIFVAPGELLETLKEQSKSSVLFKGEAFDILRDILARFPGNTRVENAAAQLLKTFEQNVNSQNSIKTILFNCQNILDYMFTQDREQFASYLQGLAEMILPQEAHQLFREQSTPLAEDQPTAEQMTPGQELTWTEGEGTGKAAVHGQVASGHSEAPLPMEQKEIAQILKGNLLPLLGEIVVKYHQNGRIRDIVMVVVHNIVRLDQGTPEALRESLSKLMHELRQVANLPRGFEEHLMKALLQSNTAARYAQNEMIEKLSTAISAVLHNQNGNPAVVRQAEALLMSMLQNESSLMNVLHFILPMNTPDGQVLAEMYVDPDSAERSKRGNGKPSRKIFLSFDSESHGRFELSFLETDDKVNFDMWCPQILVGSMNRLRRNFATIMQSHGYTMNGFAVEELVKPQNIIEVFPRLLDRKVGIDVRI